MPRFNHMIAAVENQPPQKSSRAESVFTRWVCDYQMPRGFPPSGRWNPQTGPLLVPPVTVNWRELPGIKVISELTACSAGTQSLTTHTAAA